MFSSHDPIQAYIQNAKKIDRSAINKSKIKPFKEILPKIIIQKKEKLNGFQYQLKYKKKEDKYSVCARYPQAPQILIDSDRHYDFDINVEIAPTLNSQFEIRIINITEMGGLIPLESGNDHIHRKMSQFVKFIVDCSFTWPYNKPDGLILVYEDGDTEYLRKHPTTDLMFDSIKDECKIMSKYYENGLVTYVANEWASEIMNNHLSFKGKAYKDSLRKIAIENDKKKSTESFILPSNSLNLTLEQNNILEEPGPIYPLIPRCYNVPITYTSYDKQNIKIEEDPNVSAINLLYDQFHKIIEKEQSNATDDEEMPKFVHSFYS